MTEKILENITEPASCGIRLDNNMKTKACHICGNVKYIEEFYKNKGRKDGTRDECKECTKRNYIENRKVKLEIAKRYREKNKLKIEQYFKSHKDAYKQYREKNVKRISEYKKQYYNKNKEKICKYKQRYSLENRYSINQRATIRRKNNINYKLSCYLRSRLTKVIRNNYKSGSAVRDLGCSVQDFKFWIEQQFKPGMTWENYGEWHIDHVIPLSKFDLADTIQLKKACHWFNLQPLWAEENIRKGAAHGK
jgi:hypothetical protein